MEVFDRINELLKESGYKYDVLEHEPVHTSEDAARVRDTDISMGAKALVFSADKKPLLVVVPANKRVKLKKIKNSFCIKDLFMLSPDEVYKVTGLKVGSIPPLGKVLDIDSVYHEEIVNKDKVVFNAGSLTKSVMMKAKDLIELEQPSIADIG